MSETPRTDAEAYDTGLLLLEDDPEPDIVVQAKFARTLERELAAVTRERDEARTEVEFRMADSVALVAAQERIRYLKMDLEEKERPLDAEMARLNQNLIAANDAALKAGLERIDLRAEVERLTSAKDGAYEERNRCVALIARMALSLGYRAGLSRTAIEGWSEDWHGCIYIDLPTGQVSWHYHNSHAHLFEGLPKYPASWDGHDTPEKYRRVHAALTPAEAPGPSKEWCARMAELEGDSEIGAGTMANVMPAEEPKPRDLDALAIRFLTWKLPDDVCADPCASNPGYPGRSGTNLLNAPQARAMLAYVLDAEEPKT